jgi:hypothetical protein
MLASHQLGDYNMPDINLIRFFYYVLIGLNFEVEDEANR